MHYSKRLWLTLLVICLASFGVLLWLGGEIYQQAPPIPAQVITTDGEQVFTGEQIQDGQEAWFKSGGQQLGSVWGHGSYVAPDWSADWLHREALALRDIIAEKKYQQPFDALTQEQQLVAGGLMKQEMRHNSYDALRNVIIITPERAKAIREVAAHYDGLFSDAPDFHALRVDYAMKENTLSSSLDRQDLGAFFFWSAWAATTERLGDTITYTSNWPHEALVGNTPSASLGIWSIASVILLLGGIGALVWYHFRNEEDETIVSPASDPLFRLTLTPSMRATTKYFYVVIALFMVQIFLGSMTAHYSVEGQDFFGIPLSKILPYTVLRSWHTQLSVLWIATAWLATGLYIAPLISGKEPAFQRLGVNILFVALLILVVGSLGFGWLGAMGYLDAKQNFYIGAQGLEFTNMGRMWQWLLFIGLMIWLVLVGRALWPALTRPSENRGLIMLMFLAAICIGLFYSTSLIWGFKTHYAIIEYWRWWLVHLWVEGFFEVFATAVIALIFCRLGLIRSSAANKATLFSTIIFLFGGILGTLHHLYFTGAPISVIAWGSIFSALEVVPLSLVGIEAAHSYSLARKAPWVQRYRWMIFFFVAVAFWNMVGAGLLGFAINPPISLYYVQGLNLTAAHAHAALFGVYGMLGIGLMLFCLRGLLPDNHWVDSLLKWAFWLMNIGLTWMVFVSLLPVGIYQSWASIDKGLWYARSPEVIHSHIVETLVWLRVPGDIIFGIGGLLLALFALKLLTKANAKSMTLANEKN
ncbi:nitric-oxide reductase large subunit [Citrobacter freundii]|uniref:Nitric-oxide reductase large subunit n=1 Tax=Citrobacter freundii TaxID=546 RepID=A0ABD7AWY0_CITFR|nr:MULTISPECIES: nitric-oxide reductase large subunit [Citrobacter freundii complex]QLX24757.1 nitric-oxide reductase large subunit [Citrobacter freundii]QLY36396.1 nitric-oxide reductase large subunit [Citrobacter freundii]QMA46616.1 nitric-oxide reductase large subunit [Citrobacter freundii]